MRRGVAALCLALTLWHGRSAGQTRPLGTLTSGPPPVVAPASPVAPVAPAPLPAAAAEPAEVVGVPEPGILPDGHEAEAVGKKAWKHGWVPGIRGWAGIEYLMWMMEDSDISVPLVTSGVSEINFPPGALDQDGTRVLIGQQGLNGDITSGVRTRLGFEIGDSGFGVEGLGFMLDQRVGRAALPTATENPSVLALPFFDVNTGQEGVALLTDPNAQLEGSFQLALRTNLSGAEGNFGYVVNTRFVDWVFIGYRYLNLTEELSMHSRFQTSLPGVVSFLGVAQGPNTFGEITDSFRTGNEFSGGQFGCVKRICLGRGTVMIDARASVALGNTHQLLSINGESRVSTVGDEATPPRRAVGGLYAQRSNIGRYERDHFSVVPEVSVTMYVQAYENLLAYVGYSFLYWNNVVRPGEQLDRRIEQQQVPFSPRYVEGGGGLLPGTPFSSSNLNVHGLHAGLALQF